MAMFIYGFSCLDERRGVPLDEWMATSFIKRAAEQGEELSQFVYATRWQYEKGAFWDDAAAAIYYHHAAEQGHAEAQAYYDKRLVYGTGVAKDFSLVAQYLRRSADQGRAERQAYYGQCLNNGTGVARGLGSRRAALSAVGGSGVCGGLCRLRCVSETRTRRRAR
jgi:TPR repeat protein